MAGMSDWGGRRDGSGRPRGSKSPNTKRRHEAIKAVVAKFEATIPDVFDGDAVALMQLIYRDPRQDIGLRLDAARAAAKFERPALQATLVRDVTPQPATQADANRRIQELLARGLAHVEIDATAVADGVGGAEAVGEA